MSLINVYSTIKAEIPAVNRYVTVKREIPAVTQEKPAINVYSTQEFDRPNLTVTQYASYPTPVLNPETGLYDTQYAVYSPSPYVTQYADYYSPNPYNPAFYTTVKTAVPEQQPNWSWEGPPLAQIIYSLRVTPLPAEGPTRGLYWSWDGPVPGQATWTLRMTQ